MELNELKENPQVQKLLKFMFKESGKKTDDKQKKSEVRPKDPIARKLNLTDKRKKSNFAKGNNESKTGRNVIKSPSDTTLYTPALKKDYESQCGRIGVSLALAGDDQKDLISQISDFVEKVRQQTMAKENRFDREATPTPSTSGFGRHEIPTNDRVRDETESLRIAKKSAEEIVINSEKFKASIYPPPGTEIDLDEIIKKFKQAFSESNDDEFFHITCHVDRNLRLKIEKGEFVDLEKLLPKEKKRFGDNNVMELVNQNGNTYFMPAERKGKITNIRKWEQAFRVYAAIYCNAHPHRSAEIWQYIYVINLAASSYSWDNVYYYDYTFRQLMEAKLNRSWGKTYNQLWNLTLRDPIQQNNSNFQNNTKTGDWRDRCCWRFNRGERCKKWNCRFDHRVRNCGSYSHNQTNCLKKKSEGNGKPKTFKGSPMHLPKKHKSA